MKNWSAWIETSVLEFFPGDCVAASSRGGLFQKISAVHRFWVLCVNLTESPAKRRKGYSRGLAKSNERRSEVRMTKCATYECRSTICRSTVKPFTIA